MTQTVADHLLGRPREWGERTPPGTAHRAALAAGLPELRHAEWFADHARLEPLLVDGRRPTRSRPLS
jgi:hypothetical protein